MKLDKHDRNALIKGAATRVLYCACWIYVNYSEKAKELSIEAIFSTNLDNNNAASHGRLAVNEDITIINISY